MTIPQIVEESLKGWGDFPALVEFTPGEPLEEISAPELISRVADRAKFLSRHGIGEGVLAPIFLENGIEFTTTFLALLFVGAIPVMVKMEYRRWELDEIFRNCDPQVIVTEESHLRVVEPYLDGRLAVVRTGSSFSARGNVSTHSIRKDLPSDLATLNYTYRGYGYPLGSMTTHKQYLYGIYQLQGFIRVQRGEKLLVVLPMSHIFPLIGCVLLPIVFHNTAVIARTLHPRQLIKLMDETQIQNLLAIPEIYELLHVALGSGKLPRSVRKLLSGGSLLTGERHHVLEKDFGRQIIHGYGLTEFTPVSGHISGNTRSGTMGIEGPFTDYRLVDGELQISGPAISLGYYRRPVETEEAFDGPWFKTGDLCRVDDGHLVFIGEKKRTRKVNGTLVDLTEIERAIESHQVVEDVSLRFENKKLVAEVGFNPGVDQHDALSSLRRYLTDIIATYKIPYLEIRGDQ